MLPTNRLYFEDPTGSPFDAVVVAHAHMGDRPTVILDRSGFYPESGGQMADRGRCGGLEVVDVQVDDANHVHHVLAGSDLPAIGARIRGEPDRRRRRVHQALHTGQHMLSRALIDVAGAETIASRLGETACTIDTPGETLREVDLAAAEALVNDVVDADVPVRAFFPDAETLATLPLRRAPKVTDDVRVVLVGDFDCSPCGGTHCTGSAQVGFVRVTGLERYKGGLRITFTAGPRARQSLFGQQEVLQALARGFTCGPADVPAAVERLRRDLVETRASVGRLQERLVEQIAARLLAGAGPAPRFVLSFPGEDATFLRLLGRRLAEVPGTSAILCAPATDGAGGARYLAVRGPATDFDCGAFARRLNAKTGGRGGGRVESAEGYLPVAPDDWAALVEALVP